MHAIFKDEAERVLDSAVGVQLMNENAWLSLCPDASMCEVYEDERGTRGKLVAVYVRDRKSGEWTPR